MEDELARKLAFVEPESRAVVERRISVLERHKAIEKPTTADAIRSARELGMNVSSFYRLLRAWNSARDPRSLGDVPGGRGRERGPRPHPGDDFVRRTLAELPTGRPAGRDVAAICAAADAAGVQLRSRSSLWTMVSRLRAEEAPVVDSHSAELFVDHVAIDLAVAGPAGAAMPVATVVGDGAAGAIHSVWLSMRPAGPEAVAAAILHGVRLGRLMPELDGADAVVISMDATYDSRWHDLLAAFARHGVHRIGEDWTSLRPGRVGGRFVRPRLLNIETRSRQATVPAASRRLREKRNLSHVLSLAEAQAALDERVIAAATGDPIRLPRSLPNAIRRLIDETGD